MYDKLKESCISNLESKKDIRADIILSTRQIVTLKIIVVNAVVCVINTYLLKMIALRFIH